MSDPGPRARLWRTGALSLLASLFYTVSLAPFDMGWTAFLVAWPLTCAFLDPRRPLAGGSTLAVCMLFGELTTLAVGGHWLFHATHGFFGKSPAYSLLFTLMITITHAGAFIGMGVFTASLLRGLSPLPRILGFACAWTAWELARSLLLYGCPWNLLGHAFSRDPALMQLSAFGGVYALSWLAVACGAALGTAWIERDRRARALGYAAAGLLGPILAVMILALGHPRPAAQESGESLTVGIVQTAIDKRDLWRRELRAAHLDRFIDLSRSEDLDGAELIVWSENSVPFVLDAQTDALARIQALADELDAAVVLGAPRSEDRGDGKGRLYNSVFFFRPGRSDYLVYDKVRLLPYIEALPWFARPFVRRTVGIEYLAGDEQVLFEHAGWKIGALICFESTYPGFAREYARRGADLLVNISNDSWFDRGAAPEQHFAMSVFRAPETGRPLVRVANGGVSAVLDAHGRVMASPAPRTDGVARVTIVKPGAALTPYTLLGDAFAWGCVGATGVLLAIVRRRRRRPLR